MDGFEHGFRPLREIHAAAKDNLNITASFVRTAIFSSLGLDSSVQVELDATVNAEPAHLHGAKYVRGTLLGGTGQLAADNQLFPIMMWSSTVVPSGEGDGEETPISMKETITPRLAPGVSMRFASVEIWGSK